MDRRKFLAATGASVVGAVAGCVGGSNAPPPRKSNVIQSISASDNQVTIDPADDPWVMSRLDAETQEAVSGALPVGVAQGKGGGAAGAGARGAAGRASGGYSSAAKTSKGRAWYGGGGYAAGWYSNHDDEVDRYPVTIAAVGVAYLGISETFKDDKPGPGRVPWDKKVENPDGPVSHEINAPGWYRAGTHVEQKNGSHNFRWEAVDFKVKESGGSYTVGKEWKVSPRI